MDQMTIGASKLYLLPKRLEIFPYTKEIFFNFAQHFDLFIGSESLNLLICTKLMLMGAQKI
jgi:hypothetical protein